MRRTGAIAVASVLIALAALSSDAAMGGAQDKKLGAPRNDQSRGQAKEKGAGGRAEWYADPERGWVRTDDGPEARGPRRESWDKGKKADEKTKRWVR